MKKLISIMFCLLLCFGIITTIIINVNAEADIDVSLEIIEDNVLYEGPIDCHGIIRAYKNGTVLWEYKTERFPEATPSLISEPYVNGENVYIAVNGVLYVVDINNGNVKWTAKDVGNSCMTFDKYGNVYIGGYFGPNIVVIDRNGRELYREDDSYYSLVCELSIEGDYLNIYYEDRNYEIEYAMTRLCISQFKPDIIGVTLDGKSINFDQPPVIVDGRTLVPVRAVIEEMGGKVDWNGETQTVTLTLRNNTIMLTVGSVTAYLNNEQKILDVAPQIISGRTLMPIRFIAESFNFSVNWNQELKTVIISSKNEISDNSINMDLLNCIGKTKTEIENKYGKIVDSTYWEGGKFYIHKDLKSEFYYNYDGDYNYNVHDDAPNDAECTMMFAYLDELIVNSNKDEYTIAELQSIFGEYEFVDNLDSEFYALCYYTFKYGNYTIRIESDHKDPTIKYVLAG